MKISWSCSFLDGYFDLHITYMLLYIWHLTKKLKSPVTSVTAMLLILFIIYAAVLLFYFLVLLHLFLNCICL